MEKPKFITITSGKGGVGKSTSSVNLGSALADLGYKVLIIDFDVGLSKVDKLLGLESRVIYNYVDVMKNNVKLQQAIINDKNQKDNLYILPTSRTDDKSVLTDQNVEYLMNLVSESKHNFDYVICDSPAGIESGAEHAMHHADMAIVVVNPEVQSITDADRMIGLIDSKTKKAISGNEKVEKCILVTKFNKKLISKKEMLSPEQIEDFLSIEIKGIIPSDEEKIIHSSNKGRPLVNLNPKDKVSKAYKNFALRIIGDKNVISLEEEQEDKGLFKKIFS